MEGARDLDQFPVLVRDQNRSGDESRYSVCVHGLDIVKQIPVDVAAPGNHRRGELLPGLLIRDRDEAVGHDQFPPLTPVAASNRFALVSAGTDRQ
jgi:hypothetical protein